MIAFRHADPRFPFLWERQSQPPGRWNAAGEITQYLADTPAGAWAEFLRHEEIREPGDLATIRRALWAVELGEPPTAAPDLPEATLLGGRDSWRDCQTWAAERRKSGATGITTGITAPSAALLPGGASGCRVDGGLRPGPARDGRVFALFGRRLDLIGWVAAAEGRPDEELLERVRHF